MKKESEGGETEPVREPRPGRGVQSQRGRKRKEEEPNWTRAPKGKRARRKRSEADRGVKKASTPGAELRREGWGRARKRKKRGTVDEVFEDP